MTETFIGIDPDSNGAVVIVDRDAYGNATTLVKMLSLAFVAPGEVDLCNLRDFLSAFVPFRKNARVCLERQRMVFIPAKPGATSFTAGAAGIPTFTVPYHAPMKLGRSKFEVAIRPSLTLAKIEYSIRGLLAGMNIPMESVPPGSWKKVFVHGKEPMLPVAARRFPSVTFTGNAKKKEGQATALMLAEWGMRCSEGAPK